MNERETKNIVIIEPNDADKDILIKVLESKFSSPFIIKQFNTLEAAMPAFEKKDVDLLFTDLPFADSTPEESFQFINQKRNKFPIIIFSDRKGEEFKLRSIKAGAQTYLLKDEFNEEVFIRSVNYSIERHYLQKQLRWNAKELEEKQRQLVEAQGIAQIGNWQMSPFEQQFYFSKEACIILELGNQDREMHMKSFLDLIDRKEEEDALRLFLRQAIEENSDFNIDFSLPQTHNIRKYINLRIHSNHEADLERKKIIGTVQDITTRKEIEEKLKQSEEKYRNLFDEVRDAIYITSTDGRFIEFNPATVAIFGYSPDEMRVINVKDLYLNPFERTKFQKEIQELGYVKDFPIKLKRSDGSKIDCMVTASLWQSKNGQEAGYQGIIRDITERIVAEELIKEKEIAERSSKLKESFLANMSHEIRTPINAISGLTHLLLDTGLTGKQQDYINGIQSSSSHLMALVSDILDFSKIEAGQINFKTLEFKPVSLVNKLVSTFKYKAQERNIELIAELSEQLPYKLLGDPLRLNQVLINLLSNAIKFTDKGHVKLTVDVIEESQNDYVLSFAVEDTGIGIPETKLPTIFQSFTQLEDDITKVAEGTGLGLTITKQLIELQGGTISVKSKFEEGTTFKVVLKYRKPDEEEDSDHKEAEGFSVTDIGRKRILIVEDKKLNQLVAKEMLHKWWQLIETDIADNGRIALEKLNRRDFDLILMDVQMPEMDGYEATRKIRSTFVEPTSEVPILAMTAYATTGEAEKALDAGMNDYISKPFEPKRLHDKIVNLINHKNTPVRNTVPVAPEPEPEEADILNMAYLNQITGGNQELRDKIVELLIEETPEEVGNLQEFTLNEDWSRVRGVAHKMKSSATYMGLKKTLAILKLVEDRANNEKDLQLIPEDVRKVAIAFNNALEVLKSANYDV